MPVHHQLPPHIQKNRKVETKVEEIQNKDSDVENGLEGIGKGKGKLGQSERVAWTYIHYQMLNT